MRAMKRRVARSTDWLVGDRGGERTHKLFRIGSRFAPSENAERHGPARHTHTGHRTRCSGRARTKSMIACRCAKLQYDGYTTWNNTLAGSSLDPACWPCCETPRRTETGRADSYPPRMSACPVVTVARCIYISIAIYIGVLYIRIYTGRAPSRVSRGTTRDPRLPFRARRSKRLTEPRVYQASSTSHSTRSTSSLSGEIVLMLTLSGRGSIPSVRSHSSRLTPHVCP